MKIFEVFGLLISAAQIVPGVDQAWADPISFGPNDVATVFFISKSDDHNRVDYGIRLDRDCRPISSDDAVFYYWRELENAPPILVHSAGFLDRIAYGIAEQRLLSAPTPNDGYLLRLKQIPRKIVIKSMRGPDGSCVAVPYMDIAGVPEARLEYAFVKLNGLITVDYVEIHGTSPSTRAPLVDRVSR